MISSIRLTLSKSLLEVYFLSILFLNNIDLAIKINLIDKDAGKLMISVLSAVAEIERENIRTQTMARSEERRVGKECRIGCRSRWSPYH